MTFAIRNLSVLSYANGFTLWHYRTNEDFAATLATGYFNDSEDMLSTGDIMLISAKDKCAIRGVALLAERAGVTLQPLDMGA